MLRALQSQQNAGVLYLSSPECQIDPSDKSQSLINDDCFLVMRPVQVVGAQTSEFAWMSDNMNVGVQAHEGRPCVFRVHRYCTRNVSIKHYSNDHLHNTSQ